MKKQLAYMIIFPAFIFSLTILNAQGSLENPPINAEEVPVPDFIKLDSVNTEEAPEEYTVVRGDTLWDISSRFLNSPWYWPKVWSLNPQIENPHLIYPGNVLSFRMTGQISVPGMEEGSGADAMMTEDEFGETNENARTGKTLDDRPESFKEYVQLGGKYRINKFKKMGTTIFKPHVFGFVDKIDLKNKGKVIGSFETKQLLSTGDKIYVELGEITFQPGEQIDFFTVKEEIEDFENKEVIGSKIEVAGTGRIIEVNKERIATVKITKSVDAIERGHYIREHEGVPETLEVSQTPISIEARILSGYDPVVFYGESYLVYIDKGAAVGLNTGDMYTVYRQGDGLDSIDDEELVAKLPWEPIAEIVILKTYENTSTAIITKSIVEVKRGDVVTAFGGMD